MALTDTTRPYEVLIRYREDGSIAAHRQGIREIRDGATIISSIPQPPEALTIVALKALVAALPEA